MNIYAVIAVMHLRKWFASPKLTKTHYVHPVRVRIQKRKSRLLPRLEACLAGPVFLPATIAVQAVALLDRDNR
jgi:hypothetical protein